jgi:hypothetical protein
MKFQEKKDNIYKEELEAKAAHKLNRGLMKKDLERRQEKIKEANRRDIID